MKNFLALGELLPVRAGLGEFKPGLGAEKLISLISDRMFEEPRLLHHIKLLLFHLAEHP